MKVRLLRAEDRSEWLRLRQALWPQIPLDEQMREMADIEATSKEQPVFVANCSDEGGRLCGLMEVSIKRTAPGCKTDRIGYLEAWFVDPEMRGQGIGGKLVDAAEAWAREQGCTEMASDTNDDYPVSPKAHAAKGYKITEIYFRKELK